MITRMAARSLADATISGAPPMLAITTMVAVVRVGWLA
jgi:hypothetical protein